MARSPAPVGPTVPALIRFFVAALMIRPTLRGALAAEPPAGTTVRFIVGFDAPLRDLDPDRSFHGADIVRVDDVLRFLVVNVADDGSGMSIASFLERARGDGRVAYVEEDREDLMASYAPNDPRFSSQYGPQLIEAPAAWNTLIGGFRKNVCIVDTGVRHTHEDLSANWLGGYDFVNRDSNPWDDEGHGTHVAGTAAAVIDNGRGIAGVARAGILGVKVLGASGSGSHSNVASGIRWCADNNGHVVSLSLGGGGSSTLANAVSYAASTGALIVAAAGNDGPCTNCVHYPAAYGSAIAVTCVTSSSAQCSFSSAGAQAELAAPGYVIVSTCNGSDTQYCSKSGTSMSTPHVSGVAALAWNANPDLSVTDLRAALTSTVRDLGPKGRDTKFGEGLVDAFRAVAAVADVPPFVTRFSEDFDDGVADGFTRSGMWHVTKACAIAPSAPNYLGYHSSSRCSYDNGVSATSGSATFTVDLSGMTHAVLRFRHMWETETGGATDIRRVEASRNGGASWHTLAQWSSADANRLSWTQFETTLNTLAGGDTTFRFTFDSEDFVDNDHMGWLIDDIEVLAGRLETGPIAHAGADITVSDGDSDGVATAHVDGSASRDRNGIVTAWEWFAGTTRIAEGPVADLTLPVGVHAITLRVTDDERLTDDAVVNVTVIPNRAPVATTDADAWGSDPDGDGVAWVPVDGSASSDTDGTVTAFEWFVDSSLLATGATASLPVALGTREGVLRVRDNGGASHQRAFIIHAVANIPPTPVVDGATLIPDPDGDGEATFTLDAWASHDRDGTVVDHNWFEGGLLVSAGPTVTLTRPVGVHELTLVVEDDGGATSQAFVTVTVDANHAPIADPGPRMLVSDADGTGAEVVTLDGTRSTDPAGAIVAYEWRVGGALIAVGATPGVMLPVGDHDVTLIVGDAAGATDSADVHVTVLPNAPPLLVPPPDRHVKDLDRNGAETVTLEAMGEDPDGSIAAWEWRRNGFVIGTSPTLVTGLPLGAHTLHVMVTDNGGASVEDVVNITVAENLVPVARIEADCENRVCHFDARASYDPDGTITDYYWQFADGSTARGTVVDHTYILPRTYRVELRVTDDNGGIRTHQVNVIASDPKAAPTKVPHQVAVRDTKDDGVHVENGPGWWDVQSAWFDGDSDNVYVGLALRDIPGSQGITGYTDYRVRFMPAWNVPDPTWGGALPAGFTMLGLEVRAYMEPVTNTASGSYITPHFDLQLVSVNNAGQEWRTRLADIKGTTASMGDLIWWPILRSTLQGVPPGAALHSTRGTSTVFTSFLGGFSHPMDDTGIGGPATIP